MNAPPKYYVLCILIPCYNNLAGLKKSLKSIVYERGKYLIVIVDDGSNNEIQKNALSENNNDELPVHIIRLPQNSGITIALNTGLQWIKNSIRCDYIARLDCGDTCTEDRFYKQIAHLSVNPDVLLLGSWCYFQNQEKSVKFKHKAPIDHGSIVNGMYFRNVFIHPTIIIRVNVLEQVGLYPEDYLHAEDYAWFWKIANQGKTGILPLYLVVCELNMTGISYVNREKQLKSRMEIIKEFGHKFAFRELAILKTWLLMKIPYSIILQIKKLISF